MDYSIFPYWMGINNFGELILAIIAILALFLLYILFGSIFCPNSIENHFVRAICIIFWPVMITIEIILLPFVAIYELSKPIKIQEKELLEFIDK